MNVVAVLVASKLLKLLASGVWPHLQRRQAAIIAALWYFGLIYR